MSRLTLRLPETLHRQLETEARREGISLNQYILYALTRHVAHRYLVQPLTEESVDQQQEEFNSLLQRLGQASAVEVEEALALRELAEPETELRPEAVQLLIERLKHSGVTATS